jgi:hypothetical protein
MSVPLLIGVAIDSSGSVGRDLQRGKELEVLCETGGFVSTFESPAQLQTALEKLRQIPRTSYMLQYKKRCRAFK